ncbi:MAG TPA: UPF0182 family protein [Candidatus Limnocylindria bacterium]|nr:UPF0182 family protein [Candidatus Limnocylindria bacterium]
MSTWFDKLLEELQRRQAEQDARREGRPFPRRTNGGVGRRGGGGDDGPPPDERPVSFPGRRGGQPSVRRWALTIIGIVVLLFAFGIIGRVVDLATDLMWYGALGLTGILTTRLWAQLALFAIGFFAFAIPALASIWLARRIAPQVPIRRIGQFEVPDASRAITIGLVGAVALLALISAAAWSGSWETVLLFLNGGPFGTTDPHFGRDIGFYVFDLPFWRFLQGWAVVSLVGILLLTLGAYAAGALRWQFRLTAPVRAHVSVLGAVLLGAIAVGYQLDIFDLSFSTRGMGADLVGASYTDLNAQQPALVALTFIAGLAAVLVLANTWFRTLWLIGLSVAGWFALSLIVGGIFPAAIQAFRVSPNELALERPQIAANIGATRAAFGLDAITQQPFTGTKPLTRPLFDDNRPTMQNIRLWDYRPLLDTITQTQILRSYYEFADVDIDRYHLGGAAERQVMLSGRELAPPEGQTWTNEHLFYTHGYGVVAVPVNAVTPEGQPDYLASGINQQGQLQIDEPRIYFGETASSYVVTGTRTDEFDYPVGADRNATTSWKGTTGVGIGGYFSKLLWALRLGDLNLLISNQLTDDSQILFRRSLEERVQAIAPFLTYDHDPYLVSADGRLVWVWDAYTSTDRYPDAQPLDGELFGGMNYVRNSVKVTVDAYDGKVHMYIVDDRDPIIAAWARIFPDLFSPMSSMSQDLRAHLRYPEDLFTAQNLQYQLYHVSSTESGAETLYSKQDRWALASQGTDVSGTSQVIEPYYVIMKLPGQADAEFVLIQPMVTAGRNNMIAWVAARMDPGHYGERISFHFPSDTSTFGPAQIQSRINQDSTVSAQFTLWSQAGSSVVRGNLLVLPMGDSLLYMEPIFLRSTSTSQPEFKRVILASQTRIAFADTVDQAVSQLLGETGPPPPSGGGGGQLPEDVAGLVAQAQQLYADAQDALAAGDLGTYQAKLNALQPILDRLAELTGASASPEPSASPSP